MMGMLAYALVGGFAVVVAIGFAYLGQKVLAAPQEGDDE